MLSENIKTLRRAKGMSQEALAVKLNVVRQTISKWEKGLSAPDADMLTALADALEVPSNVLLGETVDNAPKEDLQLLLGQLENIKAQLSRRKIRLRKWLQCLFAAVCAAVVVGVVLLYLAGSPYLAWDYQNPETAVIGVLFHAIEWLFVRAAPVVLTGAVAGIFLTRRILH